MVLVYVAFPAIFLLAGVTLYLLVRCKKYRRAEKERVEKIEKNGLLVEVAPWNRDAVKEEILQSIEAQKGLMDIIYYSCDNFQKYQGRIAEYMEEMYNCGILGKLCANIVYLANMAENGAFYSLAREYKLSELELRTCCFIYFGFKWQHTCTADSLTENAYSVRCSRIRKKFSLAKEERIPDFLENWCNSQRSSSSGQ